MDWWLILVIFFGALVLLLLSRLPVAFCFMAICIVGAYLVWGGEKGLYQLVAMGIVSSLCFFGLVALPLFILMGEVLFHSGMALQAIGTIDRLMGRLPGRLGVVAIVSGALFGALSGSSLGSAAMLGTMLTPEMENRGYKKAMSLGSVMSGGGLASIIPPSGMAVLIGAIAGVSIGRILISGVFPGIFLAIIYIVYIVGRCRLQPWIAPGYTPTTTTLFQKIVSIGRDLLPFSFIILAVTGAIFMGIATPTEAAALGVLASFILAACYRSLTWNMVKKATDGTLRVTSMIFLIIALAIAFSQIIAYTGATRGLIEFVVGLNVHSTLLIVAMVILVLFLGSFMDSTAIIMITIPIFLPIIKAIGYDQLLFCLLLLISIETGFLTPPFGIILFAMKGIAPPDTTTADIYKAAIPFVVCNVVGIALIIVFPQIALLLPHLMRR